MTLRSCVSGLLFGVAIGCLGYSAWSLLDLKVRQQRDSRLFDEARQEMASAPPPESSPSPSMKPSAPARATLPSIGRLTVPRVGLVAMIEEGDDDGTLRHALGHIPGTALPGSRGNIAIAGHRDSLFRGLEDLRRDDEIDLDTLSGSYRYRVDEITVIAPDNTSVLAPTRTNMLTLVTCFPFHYIGPAPRRYVVRATEISATLTNPHKSASSRAAHSRPESPQCPAGRTCGGSDLP